MKEGALPEGLFESVLGKLPPVGQREAYVKDVLIPKMDRHRRRSQFLSAKQIEDKLTSMDYFKLGEEHEVCGAIRQSGDKLMTPELALEIADLIYYWLQPNYSTGSSEPAFIDLILGDWDLACAFCVIKYETRMACGAAGDHKLKEALVMSKFLGYLSTSGPQYEWLSQ